MREEQEKIPWGYAAKTWLPNIWVHYKLTQVEYTKLWNRQDGKCAGCRVDFAHPLIKDMNRFGVKPEIDHEHVEEKQCETEHVRGLLCRRCNDFLGKLQDNRVTLENLLRYLKDYEATK